MTDQPLNGAIAVTRFGLGARPGEIEEASHDPVGWLRAQIRREGADQPVTAPLPPTRRPRPPAPDATMQAQAMAQGGAAPTALPAVMTAKARLRFRTPGDDPPHGQKCSSPRG